MKTKTNTQLYHYILSFDERTLRTWYNNVMIDPYGDYREQTIRPFTEETEKQIKEELSLETLCEVMRNPNTKFNHDNLYIAIVGEDVPFMVSFNTFEEFLALTNKQGFLEYLQSNPENIEALEETANKEE